MSTDVRTQFDRRLRAADPAAGLPADRSAADNERDRALLHRIVTDDAPPPAFPAGARNPRTRRTRTSRRFALGAAGVLTAAAVTTGVLLVAPLATPGPSGSTPPGASAAAAELLGRAADITPVDPPAKASQYWRITTTGTTMSTTAGGTPAKPVSASYLVSSIRTEYVAVDGGRPTWFVQTPGKVVRQLSGPKGYGAPATDRPTEIWTMNLPPSTMPGSWQTPNPVWLRDVPRDPAKLRQRLYADAQGHGQSTDGEVLVLVADVLRSGLVPSDLRAGMYKVLATVPGVEVTATSATVGGRTGVAIGRNETAGMDRQELIIDPATGQVIGERSIAIKSVDGITAGTVIGDTAVTRTLVDAVPANVQRRATRMQCTVSADRGVECTEPGAAK